MFYCENSARRSNTRQLTTTMRGTLSNPETSAPRVCSQSQGDLCIKYGPTLVGVGSSWAGWSWFDITFLYLYTNLLISLSLYKYVNLMSFTVTSDDHVFYRFGWRDVRCKGASTSFDLLVLFPILIPQRQTCRSWTCHRNQDKGTPEYHFQGIQGYYRPKCWPCHLRSVARGCLQPRWDDHCNSTTSRNCREVGW